MLRKLLLLLVMRHEPEKAQLVNRQGNPPSLHLNQQKTSPLKISGRNETLWWGMAFFENPFPKGSCVSAAQQQQELSNAPEQLQAGADGVEDAQPCLATAVWAQRGIPSASCRHQDPGTLTGEAELLPHSTSMAVPASCCRTHTMSQQSGWGNTRKISWICSNALTLYMRGVSFLVLKVAPTEFHFFFFLFSTATAS